MSDDPANKWRVLAVTSIAVILTLTTWFSATAVMPELIRAYSLRPVESAWLTNGVQLGFVVGALASSLLSIGDIFRTTTLMCFAALIAGTANSMLLLDLTATGAILIRFLTGVSLALVYPPAMKFIATWFQTGRGLAMGVMVGALTLGSALPHLIRSIGANFDWRLVISASSVGCFLAAVIFYFALREGPYPFAKTEVDPRQIGKIIRNRPVMLANIGYFGHMWELYALWGWILAFGAAAFSSAGYGSAAAASFLAFAVIALGAPSSVVAGWFADRIGRCYTTALCMAISGTCALLIGFAFGGPVWIVILIATIWGLTVVGDSAQFTAAVTELSDQSLVGSALAFQMGIGFLITVFTVWFVPYLAEVFGSWRWSFAVLAPGPAIGVWAMLRLRQLPESTKIANGRR
ncbi:MAG: MFS transporter [Rhizobiaceae bacterium]